MNIEEFIARIRQYDVIKGLKSDVSGLRKASGTILSLYIKEIDVLTPAKLTAIRRMRAVLTGLERRSN